MWQPAVAQDFGGGTTVRQRGVAPTVRRNDGREVGRLCDKIYARFIEKPEEIRRSDLRVEDLVGATLARSDEGQPDLPPPVERAEVAPNRYSRRDSRNEKATKLHTGSQQTPSHTLARTHHRRLAPARLQLPQHVLGDQLVAPAEGHNGVKSELMTRVRQLDRMRRKRREQCVATQDRDREHILRILVACLRRHSLEVAIEPGGWVTNLSRSDLSSRER